MNTDQNCNKYEKIIYVIFYQQVYILTHLEVFFNNIVPLGRDLATKRNNCLNFTFYIKSNVSTFS